MESDSDEFVDTSERENEINLNCDCTKIHPVDDDDDELELSFSRATDDICWVSTTRLGVPTKCTSDDLVTVAVSEDDIMTFCRKHLKKVQKHFCCWHCFSLVVTGTFLECPDGHRTDPLCRIVKQRMEEREPRSCSHCGSTDLKMNQILFELEDSDESLVAEFIKIIEELEKAESEGVIQRRSKVDQWKERLRNVAPEVLIAFRQSPQSMGELASRLYSVLSLVEDEEVDLIEKLVGLRGVAKPGDLMSSVSVALESISYEGELTFKYSDVVTDPNDLTRITDEKAIMFCDCNGVCVPETCDCCTGDYGIDETDTTFIRAESIRPLMSAISECGPACACQTDCGNRLVQSGGKRYKLEIFDTGDRGEGVRAMEIIPAGRFIIEYTGAVRKLDNGDITNNYCFETVLGINRVEIDAREMGSAARCINHSCEPNAVIVKVAWDPVEERRMFHLAIFALEDIVPGKEITIDYGDGFWFAKMDEFACLCGSLKCRHHEQKRQEKLAQFEKTDSGIKDDYEDEVESEKDMDKDEEEDQVTEEDESDSDEQNEGRSDDYCDEEERDEDEDEGEEDGIVEEEAVRSPIVNRNESRILNEHDENDATVEKDEEEDAEDENIFVE